MSALLDLDVPVDSRGHRSGANKPSKSVVLYVRVTQWGKTGAVLLFLNGVVGEGLAEKVTFGQRT